jgi:small basic protein
MVCIAMVQVKPVNALHQVHHLGCSGPVHVQRSWGVYWIQRVRPSVFCFPDILICGLIFQILKWNWVWLFTMMSYRSSLSFVVIDRYVTELWALGLRIFMKISVFRTFFGLIFQIHVLKWNSVWLLKIMSYRSSLSFVVINLYLTELWALELRIFMTISVFRTFLVPYRQSLRGL